MNIIAKIKSPVALTIAGIFIVLFFSDYNFSWKNEKWKDAVNTDAYYYYRYLPTIFIYHHLDDDKNNPRVIKYFIGTPLAYLPFFGIACLFSFFCHFPVDGYSVLFPTLIMVGTLFYLLWGLYFFSKLLKLFSFPDWIICVTLIAITFCTNIFYSAVIAPGWCHIVAFSLVCLILYHSKKLFLSYNKRSLFYLIVATSFLFWTRPTDIFIILIIPFLATNFNHFKETLLKAITEKKIIFSALLLAAIPMVCQLAIYKVHTGKYFVWSYSKEGFDFLHPELKNVLVGYAKGLFIYTPITFISLFGLNKLFKVNRFLFLGVVVFLSINIYVIASWWCWNYGYSFGARAFIESYPVFFLLLAFLLCSRIYIRIVLLLLFSFFAFLNLFQTYQAEHGILDKDFKTDAKGYWDVFLRTDKGYSGKYFQFPVNSGTSNIKRNVVFFDDMETNDSLRMNNNTRIKGIAHSGVFSSKVNETAWYSVGAKKEINEIPYDENVLIRATAWFNIKEKGSGSFFAISFVCNQKGVNYNPFGLDGYIKKYGEWEQHVFEMYMPKLKSSIDSTHIEFYLFNNSKTDCYMDDLKIEFIEYKKLERVLDIDWER